MIGPIRIRMAAWVLAGYAGACAWGGSLAWARQDLVPGSRYTSARAAAMGDAGLPLGDDGATALFYNPAVLGKLKQPRFEPVNFSVYANSGYVGGFDIKSLNFIKITSLSSYLSTLQKSPETYAGAGAAAMPSFYMKGLAFGVLVQSQLNGGVTSSGDIKYKSLYQLIPTVGGGIRLASGIVRLGYSLQWVNQSSGSLTVPSDTDPLGYNQGIAQGSALSHNLGFALTLPYANLPSLNIVARNVGTAKFKSSSAFPMAKNSSGTPTDEPMTVDMSISYVSKAGGGSQFNIVLEDRDATNQSKVTLFGRLAAGIEFGFKDTFFLRGGWGSGYPSAGIGLRRSSGELGLTWYSEELGSTYQEQRDARFLMHYQIRAF